MYSVMDFPAFWSGNTNSFSHTFPHGPRYFAWLLQKITSARGFNARPVRTPGWTGYDLPVERPFAGSGMYAEMSPLWLFNHYCEPSRRRSSRKLLPLGHCCCHLRLQCMQRTRFGKEGSRKPLSLPSNVCRSSLLFEVSLYVSWRLS